MFEEIIALKIQDPKTGLVSNTFVKNAEEYSEIMSNQYVCSCIIEQEKATCIVIFHQNSKDMIVLVYI